MKHITSFLLVIIIICHSCYRPSPSERDLRLTINETLRLMMFDEVQQGNVYLSYEEFRQIHKYFSVVYLQDGCSPCYPKYIEWQKKMESLETPDDYTVLFIIGGKHYSEFMGNVLDIEYVDDKFYTIMDPELRFLENNKDIPDWILNSSMLIDSENKIKMVGAPWVNGDMKNLFYKIVRNEQ